MAGELVERAGMIQFGDTLLFGPHPYRWRGLEGWEELPALDDASALRSGSHGADPGALLAQARIVTLDINVTVDAIGAAIAGLSRGTTLRDDEQPLVVWLDDRGPLLAYGRVIRRRIPVAPAYRVGVALGCTIQWSCSDPRRYEVTEQTATTGLPVAEDGIEWGSGPEGLDWSTGPEELDWGSAGSTGGVIVTNSGDADTHPIIEFAGPVDRPSVTLNGGTVLEYDIALGSGDVLVVNTAAGTVQLGGQDRLHTITARSVPEQTFTLPPGTSDLAFRADDSGPTGGTLTVRWRSAMW